MLIREVRVGVPLIGGQHWLGGVTYLESLLRALATLKADERPRLYLIVQDETLPHLALHEPFVELVDGVVHWGHRETMLAQAGIRPRHVFRTEAELNQFIDFRFPIPCNVLPGVCSGSWIPDFQHVRLP